MDCYPWEQANRLAERVERLERQVKDSDQDGARELRQARAELAMAKSRGTHVGPAGMDDGVSW